MIGETIICLAGGLLVAVLAYGFWMDPLRPWMEELLWRRDQRRIVRALLDREMERRAEDLEVMLMDAHFALPSAPDPRWLS